jgi:uncharacterized protein involved in response to NO
MKPLLIAGEPPPPRARGGATYLYGLSATGFRPFFLVAAALAVVLIPLWGLVFGGSLSSSTTYLMPMGWHAHEMVFGFACAVVAGFLLTAVRNWTQRQTATGAALYGLAALWALGRLVMTVQLGLPPPVVASIDLAFLPALALSIARPIIASDNRRNYAMIGVLALLFTANLAAHLDALGVAPGWQLRANHAAVIVLAMLAAIIAGRVIPMFTRNATGCTRIVSVAWLDVAVIVAIAGHLVFELAAPFSVPATVMAALAGMLVLVRAARWGVVPSLRHPLLWILHAGHAWIGIGFALRVAAMMTTRIPTTAGTHALTVGAIGSLTLGMMARVSLGHTGRSLVLRPITVAAFALVTLAAVLRVFGPLLGASALTYVTWVALSATAWAAAFALFLVAYLRILVSPRVDGKPG